MPIQSKNIYSSLYVVLAALLLGVLAGFSGLTFFHHLATALSTVFIKLLQLISIPIIFLAIISTIISMGTISRFKRLGSAVFKYTVLTTLLAASIALIVFLVIDPVDHTQTLHQELATSDSDHKGYLATILGMIPNNIVAAFAENNVIGIAFVAFLFGIVTLHLPEENKTVLHHLFSSLFQLLLKVASYIIYFLPVAIFSFTTLIIEETRTNDSQLDKILLFLACVLIANFIQAIVVLPLLLKAKGIPVLSTLRSVMPALVMAFFSRSSSATLPMTLDCFNQHNPQAKSVASFSLPLCTVINMNGCAAFILIAVLFVSISNGIEFSLLHMLAWIVFATLAAIGNASVPMGCYFLATAFLLAMGVDTTLMGQILMVYVIIDMVETALNVWSDCVVTTVVSKEMVGVE